MCRSGVVLTSLCPGGSLSFVMFRPFAFVVWNSGVRLHLSLVLLLERFC
jgi:hypothetical protein